MAVLLHFRTSSAIIFLSERPNRDTPHTIRYYGTLAGKGSHTSFFFHVTTKEAAHNNIIRPPSCRRRHSSRAATVYWHDFVVLRNRYVRQKGYIASRQQHGSRCAKYERVRDTRISTDSPRKCVELFVARTPLVAQGSCTQACGLSGRLVQKVLVFHEEDENS